MTKRQVEPAMPPRKQRKASTIEIRSLVQKPLRSDYPAKPRFVSGNLCNSEEILTQDERRKLDESLDSLARGRMEDAARSVTVKVS
jgi:hypothetical protein